MTVSTMMAIASNVTHEDESLDPRVLTVIDAIPSPKTYERIVRYISFGLDQEDVLLIASMLNGNFPPTDPHDFAECLGDEIFTVIFNPLTQKLEWESNSTRYIAAGEWTDGDNAFGYRPPDRVLLAALEFDGNHIRFIDSPTEEMKLAAVARTSAAIEYIKNPSEEVRRVAAKTAAEEGPSVSAEFSSKYAPHVAPTKAIYDAMPCAGHRYFDTSATQDEPDYFVQSIGPLNLFSDLLMCTAMELNSHIGNDERHADFVHVSELAGELVLSFATMQQLFLMRDMFLEALEMEGLIGALGFFFDDMAVIACPSINVRGFITWGPAAAVARAGTTQALH